MAPSVLHPNFRSVYTLLYVGALGVLLFLLLRPAIDFHSSAPIRVSKVEAEAQFNQVLSLLDIPSDSLIVMGSREQRSRFYRHLSDSLRPTTRINPSFLNRAGVPLSGWKVQAGKKITDNTPVANLNVYLTGDMDIRVNFDDELRIRSLVLDDTYSTFIAGDSLDGLMARILKDVMGYDPTQYTLDSPSPDFGMSMDVSSASDPTTEHTIRWDRISASGRGPLRIEVDIRPAIRTIETDSTSIVMQGVDLRGVKAVYHELEESSTAIDSPASEVFFFFSTIFILAGVVIVSGFTQIFKGRVLWRRGLGIFAILFITMMIWRFVTYESTIYTFFSQRLIGMDMIGQAFYFFILSFFGALSYMTWESLSRQTNDRQMDVVDAMWSGSIFTRETGQSLLVGYAFGGMALAMWAVALFGQHIVFFQYDSNLGFTEISTRWPAFSTVLNSWSSTWLIGFSTFGVVLSLLQNRIKNSILVMIIGSVSIGILLTLIGRTSASTGTVFQDIWMMIAYCAPLVIAYRYFGLIATLTAWWFGYMVIRLGVYLWSNDPFILSNGIQLLIVTGLPFVIGFFMYRYGSSVGGKRFIPDYEEKNMKQMRIEKEFQIAKDSQFALMPKTAPICSDSEVKGFFIPSFEVGGDFFDYQTVGDDLMITVVDVSGKAMKAAFSAIFTSGLLLSRVTSKHPAQVLTDINPMLHERTDKQTFITCLLARYDFNTRVFRFANAGHCEPLLKRGGSVQYLKAPIPRYPLALRSDVTYNETEFVLQPGDVVMLYSDGLPEARNAKGDLYDYPKMERLLMDIDTETLSAEQICDVIRVEILTYSEYDLADDMTVVVLKVV